MGAAPFCVCHAPAADALTDSCCASSGRAVLLVCHGPLLCRVFSARYMLIVTRRDAQPMLPIAARLTSSLKAWLRAAESSDSAPCPVQQRGAAALFQQVWARAALPSAELAPADCSRIWRIALLAHVPDLVTDVVLRVLLPMAHNPFASISSAKIEMLVAAWAWMDDAARKAVALLVSSVRLCGAEPPTCPVA